MDKRGELTSSQIITIIVLIISFTVIMIFFFMLDFKEDIVKEDCRNSVVMRASSFVKVTSPTRETVQLSCKTKDVCFHNGGECEGAGREAKKIRVRDKNELLDELAIVMYDCWWQMGEGKLDYMGANPGVSRHYCSLCDRVYFDKYVKDDPETYAFTLRELYTKLKTTNVPGGEESILFSFYGTNSLEAIAGEMKDERGEIIGSEIYKLKYYPDKNYAVVTSLVKKGWITSLAFAASGAVVGATAVILAGPSGGTSIVGGAALTSLITSMAAGATTFGGIGFVVSSPGGINSMPPTLYYYDQKALQQAGCDEFSTLS